MATMRPPTFSRLIAAGIAESVFFTLIDPQQLYLLGQPVTLPPLTTYSLGFLFFWLICACASLLTWLMLPNAARQALEHETRSGNTAR